MSTATGSSAAWTSGATSSSFQPAPSNATSGPSSSHSTSSPDKAPCTVRSPPPPKQIQFQSSSSSDSNHVSVATSLATQKLEEELDKVRADGDLALIKVHNLRQSIYRVEDEIGSLKQLDKHHKPQQQQSVTTTASTTAARPTSTTVGLAATTAAAMTNVTTSSSFAPTNSSAHLHHTKSTGEASDTIVSARTIQSLVQQQERLKKTISAKVNEMYQSRKEIENVRRKRKDLLAKERFLVDRALELEQKNEEFKKEMAASKQQEQRLHESINQLQATMEQTQEEFRSEHQRLLEELERIARPDKSGSTGGPRPGKKSHGAKPIVRQRQPFHLSRVRKMSIEQKVVSFEQKKEDLDRLVEETGITNLEEFIRTYNEQENVKAQVLSRIEAQTFINKTLQESIQALEDDMNRLNGVDEFGSSTLVHPLDLRKSIESDQDIISHWKNLAQLYADKLRILREPIYQLYMALEPEPSLFTNNSNNNANDTDTESNVSYQTTLQQIGIIQERAMQRILQKILQEMNNADQDKPCFTTLERLLRYRGKEAPANQVMSLNQFHMSTSTSTSTTTTISSSPSTTAAQTQPSTTRSGHGRAYSLVMPSELPSIAAQQDDPIQEPTNSSSGSLMDNSMRMTAEEK